MINHKVTWMAKEEKINTDYKGRTTKVLAYL